MRLAHIIYKIHKLIETKEIQAITQKEMTKRLGVSERTYIEWLRETNEPVAMSAILDMLTQLKNDDIIQVVRDWEANRNVK